MADSPRVSTVRSALDVRRAVDHLMGTDLVDDPVGAVEVVMLEAKKLEPRQIAEVVEHLRAAYPAGSVPPRFVELESTEPPGGLTGRINSRAIDALTEAAEALRLTAEYCGDEILPALEGWSWWDAMTRARHVLGWDRLPDDWRAPGPTRDPEPWEVPASARGDRHEAAVAEVLDGDPDGPTEKSPEGVDLEELADRVHGD